MTNEELAQKAILEILENRVEKLKKRGELKDGISLQFYMWYDLKRNYPLIARDMETNEVLSLLANLDQLTQGRFKLKELKYEEDRHDQYFLREVHNIDSDGSGIEDVFWWIKYSEKSVSVADDSGIFWLDARELTSQIAGKDCRLELTSGALQYRILEWFSENKGFTKTDEFARHLGTSPRTIATDISKLRKKANQAFGLSGDDFIESIQGEGYGLGKKIKIKKYKSTP